MVLRAQRARWTIPPSVWRTCAGAINALGARPMHTARSTGVVAVSAEPPQCARAARRTGPARAGLAGARAAGALRTRPMDRAVGAEIVAVGRVPASCTGGAGHVCPARVWCARAAACETRGADAVLGACSTEVFAVGTEAGCALVANCASPTSTVVAGAIAGETRSARAVDAASRT